MGLQRAAAHFSPVNTLKYRSPMVSWLEMATTSLLHHIPSVNLSRHVLPKKLPDPVCESSWLTGASEFLNANHRLISHTIQLLEDKSKKIKAKCGHD